MLFEKRSIGQKRLRSTALVPDNKASSIVFSSCAKHHVPSLKRSGLQAEHEIN